jgi:RecA-family ATPase
MKTLKDKLEGTQGEESKNKIRLSERLEKIFIPANSLYNLEHREGKFLVDKLIPKASLTGLVGESDTGKSSFLRQLAISIVYGDDNFLGFKINGGCRNVLYISTEDGEIGTSEWIKKHFGNDVPKEELLERLRFVYTTERIVSNLREAVITNCIDLIIVDSYADIFEGNMNHSNEVRNFLNQFNNLANEYGTTIIFLHHTNKSAVGKPNKKFISGSHGFESKLRSVLYLTKDANEDNLRNLSIVKGNYLSSKEKSECYVLEFNEQLSFKNTGKRVPLNKLGEESYLEMAKELKSGGKSYREIETILNEKGFEVSKSKLQRLI